MKKQNKAAKLVKEARKSLGLNGDGQQKLIRAVREQLGLTNSELAAAIGKSEAALLAWIAPEGAAKHRTMPEGIKLTLVMILASAKRAGKGR